MKKVRVAITGASGFLGRSLTSRLKKENVLLSLFDAKINDLFRVESLESFLKGADVVIHLAAANRDTNYNLVRINTLGTLGLLEGILSYCPKAKLIFASSFQVYSPKNIYGLSKKFAEDLIAYYTEMHEINSVILRISNIYGPGAKPYYNSVIATFIHQIEKGETLVVNGDGNQRRDYIYVDDVSDAIVNVMLYKLSQRIAYFNVCSNTSTSINRIIEVLKDKSGRKIKVSYNKNFTTPEWEIEKKQENIPRVPFWNPIIDIETGLVNTLSYETSR